MLSSARAAGLHRDPGAFRNRRDLLLDFQRYNLSLSADARQFIWAGELSQDFLSDSGLLEHASRVSLLYTFLTVTLELLLGLGIALLLLRQPGRFNNMVSILLAAAADDRRRRSRP